MSARAETPALPSVSHQIARAALAAQQLDLEINQVLLLFKNNGKTNRRLLHQVFKGSTKNDAEHVPSILWCMFGKVRRNGQMVPAFHPQFGCHEGFRAMARSTLVKLLKKRYKTAPSPAQVRRIFDRLQKLKMVTNTCLRQQDPETKRWSSVSGYQFNLPGWKAALEVCLITPPLQQGKKREKVTVETHLDAVVQPHHRVKAGQKVQAKPLIFLAEPSAEPSPIMSSKGGASNSSPGRVVSFQAGSVPVGALLEVSLAEENQKEPASPVALGSFPFQDKLPTPETPSFPTETISPGEGYVSASGLPADEQWDFERMERWEFMLTQFLDTVLDHSWRDKLYDPADNYTLKQRIPDCLLVLPDANSSLCGVWPLDPALTFIRLSPKDLKLGDLLKRCTGCPLRYKDWQQMLRLSARGCLTMDRLMLLLQFTRSGLGLCSMAFDFTIDSVATQVNMATLVPEAFVVDLTPYQPAVVRMQALEFDLRLKQVLPFMHMNMEVYRGVDQDDPMMAAEELARRTHYKALLSPDNVGKVLFGWETLWQDFTTDVLGDMAAQLLEQRASFVGSGTHAPETVAELERAVRLSRPAASVISLNSQAAPDLTALCHIQDFGGVAVLNQATREILHYMMLSLYAKAPQIWLNLEAAMSPSVFAQAMPVRNIDGFRLEARTRLRRQLDQEFAPVYQQLEPSKNLDL